MVWLNGYATKICNGKMMQRRERLEELMKDRAFRYLRHMIKTDKEGQQELEQAETPVNIDQINIKVKHNKRNETIDLWWKRNGRKANGWQEAYDVTECSAYRRSLSGYGDFIFHSFTLSPIVGKLEIVYVCDDAGIWFGNHISCRPDIRFYLESRGVLSSSRRERYVTRH